MPGRKIAKQTKFGSKVGEFDAHEFVQILQSAYVTEANDKFKKKTSFSPSTLGYGHGKCPRYWWHAFNGAEFKDTFDAQAVANMSNGHFVHQRLQELIETTGMLVETEKPIVLDMPPIKGFGDAIIEWNGKQIICEIKSTNDMAFDRRKFSMAAPGYHLLQILIYMYVLELDEGFLLYENKNDQNILVLPVFMSDDNRAYMVEVFEWMQRVYENWLAASESEENSEKAKFLPKRVFTRKSPSCKSCPVVATCWMEQDGVVDLPMLKVPA